MSGQKRPPHDVGFVVQDLVNRISHRGGETLAIMGEAQVNLQQVLILMRLREAGAQSVSGVAADLNLSRPAASLAIERLVQLGLAARVEDGVDRRRRIVSLKAEGARLIERLIEARAKEYETALADIALPLRHKLAAVVSEVLMALRNAGGGAVGPH
ncbi:MAG: MarR family transcriptional regulator [Caulobacteraceae bacterium]|nr:MarR family transcriptional regulator [Caulobacteraceae bacterium]